MTTTSPESDNLLAVVVDCRMSLDDQIKATYRKLSRCIESAETVRRYAGAVELTFRGHEDGLPALHEIPEVRRFIQTLHERFPYWIHFSSKASSGLALIQLCLLENVSTIRHEKTIQTEQVLCNMQALLVEQLYAAKQLYDRFGLTACEYQDLTSRLGAYMRRCCVLF